MNKTVGTCLAMSVAAIFAAACDKKGDAAPKDPAASAKGMPSDEKPAAGEVNCLGIHECKGKSACHVIGSHACAGQNACKGKGWINVPAAECQAKGGKVLDS